MVTNIYSVLTFVYCVLYCSLAAREIEARTSTSTVERGDIKGVLGGTLGGETLVSVVITSIFVLISRLAVRRVTGCMFPGCCNGTGTRDLSVIIVNNKVLITTLVTGPLTGGVNGTRVDIVTGVLTNIIYVVLCFMEPRGI